MKITGYVVFIVILSVVFYTCSEKQNRESSEIKRTLSFGVLEGSIIDDDTGNPVQARVYIRGTGDNLYMADKCLSYNSPQFGKRIGYTGEHFTTIGNTFTVKLPEGMVNIIIERGKEYIPIEEELAITAGQSVTKEFALKRWINMASKGWYSGDLHVHRPLKDLGDLLNAEDLNVAVPQTVWNSSKEPDLARWLEKSDNNCVISVDGNHVFSVISSEIERSKNSAVLMHHIGKTILPVSEYEEKDLPNIPLIEKARAAGGYIDVEKPWWPESHIDVAAGNADFVGILNNHLTYRSYLPEQQRNRTEFRDDYPEGAKGYIAYVLDLYYAYLNCGFRVMPSAGSASGVFPNPLGYNRVYAKINGDFSYESWFAALKSGHSFATNGPMLIMTADNIMTGETVRVQDGKVHVICEIYSYNPVDRLEIIRDGEIVLTVEPKLTDNSAVSEVDIPVTVSGWIVARCFEKIEDTVRLAHTAPVFTEVEGKPFLPKKYAVDYFLRKTRELIVRAETGEYPSEESRDAAMGVYQRAEALFENLLEKSQ